MPVIIYKRDTTQRGTILPLLGCSLTQPVSSFQDSGVALGAVVPSPLHVAGPGDVIVDVSALVAGDVDVFPSGFSSAGADTIVATLAASVVGAVLSASGLACGVLLGCVVAAPSVVAAVGGVGLAASVCSGARSLFIIVVTRTAFCGLPGETWF